MINIRHRIFRRVTPSERIHAEEVDITIDDTVEGAKAALRWLARRALPAAIKRLAPCDPPALPDQKK